MTSEDAKFSLSHMSFSFLATNILRLRQTFLWLYIRKLHPKNYIFFSKVIIFSVPIPKYPKNSLRATQHVFLAKKTCESKDSATFQWNYGSRPK